MSGKDIFDIVSEKRSDIFDKVMLDKVEGDIFERVDKKIPSIVRSYVNKKVNSNISEKEIIGLIRHEIGKTPVVTKIEKQIIKEIKKEDKKEDSDTLKKSEENIKEIRKKIEDFDLSLEELKKAVNFFSQIGGSGVIGVPSPSGHSGEFLTTDGSKIYWATVPQSTTPTFLLLEDGFKLLSENGVDALLLE